MISGRTSIIGEQRSASVFETPAMRPSAWGYGSQGFIMDFSQYKLAISKMIGASSTEVQENHWVRALIK